MSDNHFLHQRRTAMRNAIECVRRAGKEGITSTALADEMLISCTTAKSYLRAMSLGKVVKSTSKRMPLGYKAFCYVLAVDENKIAAFLASELVSKKANPPKRRGITIKADPVKNGDYPTVDLPGGTKARVYADLPLEFFRPAMEAA